MADLCTIGAVTDTGGRHVPVIVDGAEVTLPGLRFSTDQADELTALLITAFWHAERNAAALAKAGGDA